MKKQPKVKALFEQLKEGIQAITSSEDWKQILLTQAKFHTYSFNNVMLILSQRPTASRVASYGTWKALGRQVVKGAQSIKIIAPHTVEVEDPETGEKKKKLGYHQTSVFDISDTKGEPLPSPSIEELTQNTKELKNFYELLKGISPVPVREETIKGGAKGYYRLVEDDIAIKKGMAAHQKCKTLVHEIAHAMLHRLEDKEARAKSSNEREVEAEGTAFVVLTYFGFDTSQYSFPYVASWNGDDIERIEKAGGVIQKAAAQLISNIEAAMAIEAKSKIA
ncbi:ArdC-like ssDNA-binding domain-containing protein [Paenibacillus hubeiensis]|uniref:ArdC-like ssDNA-binding domain-containing protein n=1 Tax=Paenibacillus hubeiensis TaxID=3077330 RepID=UPI0031BB12D0